MERATSLPSLERRVRNFHARHFALEWQCMTPPQHMLPAQGEQRLEWGGTVSYCAHGKKCTYLLYLLSFLPPPRLYCTISPLLILSVFLRSVLLLSIVFLILAAFIVSRFFFLFPASPSQHPPPAIPAPISLSIPQSVFPFELGCLAGSGD